MRSTLLLLAPLILALALPPALAQEAETVTPLPKPRPAETAPSGPEVPLPRVRPDAAKAPAEDTKPEEPATGGEPKSDDKTAEEGVPTQSEPLTPARIYQSGCPAVIEGKVTAELQAPISDGQCGAQSPWLVSAVAANGRLIPFSSGVTTSCEMATALPDWIADIDRYIWARDNTHVVEITTGTGYLCRNVNNAKTGNLSFHAFANALDVMGFKLEDGRTVTVEGGWPDALSSEGRLLRFAHDSACSRFTTTLGPEANALHKNHLHVDLGCHGKACTARLCE